MFFRFYACNLYRIHGLKIVYLTVTEKAAETVMHEGFNFIDEPLKKNMNTSLFAPM